MYKLLLLYSLLQLAAFAGKAQHGYYFNHFGVDEGLSNNAILCSVQDKNGFLWFGTKDGLNRFDGYSFKQFYSDTDSNNGLGSNFIHSLLVDRNNNIWVGTDQGIYIFDPRLERFSAFNAESKGEILQIEEDRNGTIWFISNNQLFCFSPIDGQVRQRSSLDKDVVSAFGVDQDGKVWIGTGHTIKNLDSDVRFSLPTGYAAPVWIEKIYEDSQHILWIGTSKHGIYRLDVQRGTVHHELPSVDGSPLFVRDIQEADKDHFWIATESGVVVYDKRSRHYEKLRHQNDHPWSLSDNAVYTICKDHQGGIWVGTFFGGLNYYHAQHTIFQKIFPRSSVSSIQGHAVREIRQDRHGQLWLGTEDNGLYSWTQDARQSTNFQTIRGLSHTNIHGLAVVGDSLLVGTFDRGLDIVDVRTKKLLKHLDTQNSEGLSNNFIYQIYRTKKGRVLLATARGLCEFFPGKDTFRLVKEAPSYIFYTSIFEDAAENLWLATWRDGLYHINCQTGHSQVFLHSKGDANSLNSNRVNHIFEDSFGQLWIATENGLACWTGRGTAMKRLTKTDGLPSNLILAMREDAHQNLWITTTRGLVKMHLPDLHMQVYDKNAGLLDLQFNYNSSFADADGHFYFGSSTGLIKFHPDSLNKDLPSNEVSPLYITRMQVLQRELNVGNRHPKIDTAVTYLQTIELDHDESTITIDFASLNFVSAQSTAYMYILEGFDGTWTLLRNSRSAHFTKIPAGTYTFRLKAVDADGKPLSEERRLKINVRPAAWVSTPALLLYAALGSLLVYVLLRSYDRRIKEKNRRRLEAIKNHRERELFKTRMDFFARVAHDIKTPLTLIKAPLERLMDNKQRDAKTDRLLNTMQHNTDKLVTLTNQLLDFKKIESREYTLKREHYSINQLISERLQDFQFIFNQRQLALEYHCTEVIAGYVDIEILAKIVDNLLSNASKYASTQIIVRLAYTADRQGFRFTIKTDGRLLTSAEVDEIFKPFHRASRHHQIEGTGLGLALAHSFAELHSGTLFFLDNSENLNIFVLQIPIKQAYD